MKYRFFHARSIWVLLLFLAIQVQGSELTDRLAQLPDIKVEKALESSDSLEKLFFTVRQQLDWENPSAGSFTQRVVLKHRGFDKPTVIVTEGYGAAYAFNPNYREELSDLLDANMVFVEYRYFFESTPNPCNWDYLTVKNSVYDYHHIRTLLGQLYPGKWFSTGISKGGQTTLFYRTYFPEDVDGSVSYVAPLNKALEDGRHEPFIDKVGTPEQRNKIQQFQLEVLKRRSTLQPLFEKYCQQKQYTFRTAFNEIYDLCVLEYSFAFWQWGEDWKRIPEVNASDSVVFAHFIEMCEPDYFSRQTPYTPFNVQAMREIGYYGYDTTPFRPYLSIPHAEGYLRRVMIPEELSYLEFRPELYEKVTCFLKEKDIPMIFIYGENDPWTASGVTWLKDKEQIHVFVQPGGSHKARIGNMPEEMKRSILNILKEWLVAE